MHAGHIYTRDGPFWFHEVAFFRSKIMASNQQVEDLQVQCYLERLNILKLQRHQKECEAWAERRDQWNTLHSKLYGPAAAPFTEPVPAAPTPVTVLTQEDDLILAIRNELYYLMNFNYAETRSKNLSIRIKFCNIFLATQK